MSTTRAVSLSVEHLWRELRLSIRRLAATPLFAVFAVLSLAIGVGATTAVYALVYDAVFPAGGMRDLDRLFYVTAMTPSGRSNFSWAIARGDFEELRASAATVADLAAWTGASRPYIDGAVAEVFSAEAVTSNAFAVAGVPIVSGRALQPSDDTPTGAFAMVLSHDFWQRKLGGATDVVGRAVRFGGQPFQIVGVADSAFKGFGVPHIGGGTQRGWIPLSALAVLYASSPAAARLDNHDDESLSVFGRLRPEASMAGVNAAVAVSGQRLDIAFPIRNGRGAVGGEGTLRPRRWSAMAVSDALAAQYSRGSVVALVVLIGLVIVVACTNLANLMLARGSIRQHEFAVRRALGASRWRLVREQSIESILLAAGGGILAIVVARLLLYAMAGQVPPGFDFLIPLDLPSGVLGALASTVFLTLLVFGLWPALQTTRPDTRGALAAGSGTVRWRTKRSLITLQVGVSAVFLFIAALCVESVVSDRKADPGIDIDHLALATVNFELNRQDEARARVSMDRMLDLARRESSIEVAAIASSMPFEKGTLQASLSTTEKPFTTSNDGVNTYVVAATPEIFRTLNVSLLKGRLFDAHDDATAGRVVVMSVQAARSVFGTADVVQRQVLLRFYQEMGQTSDVAMLTVVGTLQDTDAGFLGNRRTGLIYLPLAQQYEPNVWLVGRTSADSRTVSDTLRTIIRQADPDLAVSLSGSGAYLLGWRYVQVRVLASIAGALGVFALLLSMAGLYGVLSHIVARRKRELGLRLALGATSDRLLRMVLADGVRPVVAGLAIGLIGGTIGRGVFRAVVAGPISIVDPVALALVPIPLLVAALIACYLPARRAARVDPNVALRDL
jgi:predicted permease